ncbi:ATP-binding protein [Nannocystis pusilla]|uniref:ATP-binding protein n=2 Tax=Nannocystis TaxID=53 RepID=UPI003B778FB7
MIREPLSSWPVRQVLDALVDSLDAGVSVRLVVAGQPGSGRRSFAAAVFHALEFASFLVDVAALGDADPGERCRLVVRHARVLNAIPIWHLPPEARALPVAAAEFGLAAVVCAAHDRPAPVDGVVDLRVDLPAPDLAERAALWRRLVPTARTWPEEHVLQVSRRYALPVGDLAAVGLRRPASVDAAAELCRERSRHHLGELGHVLRCPFDLADLVVPAKLRDHLAEFVFEARDRAEFWERPEARRLYPRGTGLVALFTGPAGTGKTMAAQVLAAQLGQDLVRIDLATIVSKYIGETAKNLRKIFSVAAGMSAVLLFDEADALFARRTDVRDSHDRHANSDTNYLLQLLEDFAGVAVLASNKKANIDPAFIRRIRHVLDFPRPDAAARRQIWQQVLSELGAEVSPAALDTLGGVDLSGAQIKNAVLAATFVARSGGARSASATSSAASSASSTRTAAPSIAATGRGWSCMSEPQLRIGSLSVRVPGDDRGAGERLAAGLHESLQAVPIARSRELGAVRLRVTVPHDAGEAETLRAVQRALIQALHQE